MESFFIVSRWYACATITKLQIQHQPNTHQTRLSIEDKESINVICKSCRNPQPTLTSSPSSSQFYSNSNLHVPLPLLIPWSPHLLLQHSPLLQLPFDALHFSINSFFKNLMKVVGWWLFSWPLWRLCSISSWSGANVLVRKFLNDNGWNISPSVSGDLVLIWAKVTTEVTCASTLLDRWGSMC